MRAKKTAAKKTRTFKRHPSSKTIAVFIGGSRVPKIVSLSDIGMGGLSFKLDKELKIGDPLFVRSVTLDRPQRIEAQVVWVKKAGADYVIGVVFPDQHYASRAVILGSMIAP